MQFRNRVETHNIFGLTMTAKKIRVKPNSLVQPEIVDYSDQVSDKDIERATFPLINLVKQAV